MGALEALTGAGIRIIEVPLNSPRPLESLRLLAAQADGEMLIGAGTVLTVDEVYAVAETGARLIVAPNADTAVIARAKSLGLFCLPGVATPSEAFAALKAGADGLKMFPAEALPPAVMKAWLAVLPAGNIAGAGRGNLRRRSMAGYVAAGAVGLGIGSSLYKPALATAELKEKATQFHAALS